MTASLDYIDIDNTCPVIRLWQQYKKHDTTKSFFSYLKTYWQERYFNYINNYAMPELSVYNASSKYLYYYSENLLGIKVPIKIEEGSKFDLGLGYDTGIQYDIVTGSVPLTYTQFKKVLLFILDWSHANWDIPTMYSLISDFTGLDWNDILISQDDTNLDLFTLSMPETFDTILFELMLVYYKEVLGVPFGINFSITLT